MLGKSLGNTIQKHGALQQQIPKSANVLSGGRFWTKFEHCSPKTLTRNSDSRRLRRRADGSRLTRAEFPPRPPSARLRSFRFGGLDCGFSRRGQEKVIPT